ncbi:MAG: glycoside hydrolase family 28 protein, partial [Bacillota bacterium]|nr:glycoside hydrolase family 28 protein [Bacillota bacterium]
LLDVRAYGAKGDGATDDTAAIQHAIDACPAGGTVRIPEGVYESNPIFLKSHLTLVLDKGAVLHGLPDRSQYPILPAYAKDRTGKEALLSGWEGGVFPTNASLLTALYVTDAHIVGEGIVDCGASRSTWWVDWKNPVDGAYRAKGIYFAQCDGVGVHGILLRDTPSWSLHPFFCKNVDYIEMRVENPKDSPNTDGCDPDSCDGVRILGVDFSVGDDCIAIKSGKFDLGMTYRTPSENIHIRNCRMADGHGAVVLGSEMSGGIRNLEVRNCLFVGTDRGLRIKTRRGRGRSAVIDGVAFENIRMDGVLTPFVINMYYFCDADGKTPYVWSKDPLPVDERTPRLGRFTFYNIVCTGAQVAAGFFYGLPEQPIGAVELEQVHVSFAKNAEAGFPAMMSNLETMKKHGLFFRFVDAVRMRDVRLSGQDGPEAVYTDVGTVESDRAMDI